MVGVAGFGSIPCAGTGGALRVGSGPAGILSRAHRPALIVGIVDPDLAGFPHRRRARKRENKMSVRIHAGRPGGREKSDTRHLSVRMREKRDCG